MIRKIENSRFYPCQTRYRDGWCSGLAVLGDLVYQCDQCHSTWDVDGLPLTKGRKPCTT